MDYNKLIPEEEKSFVNKATEDPFEGEVQQFLWRWGIYLSKA